MAFAARTQGGVVSETGVIPPGHAGTHSGAKHRRRLSRPDSWRVSSGTSADVGHTNEFGVQRTTRHSTFLDTDDW